MAQTFEVKEFAGQMVVLPVFKGLSDEDLQAQMEYYLEREDYDYCSQLKVEAEYRGIRLKNKSKAR